MTRVEIVIPDGRTLVAEFARVPAANERVVLDAIAADPDEEGEMWPEDVAGKRYHVGGVTWAPARPSGEARPIIFLVGGDG